MSAGNTSGEDEEPRPGGGFGVDDVFYTLFRHKTLILTFVCLGVVAAVVVRFVKPPLYQSKAKLNVPYVVETKAVNTANPDTQIISTGSGGLSVIESEIEILKSLDLCMLVAEIVGPEKILANKGGGNNPMAAAGVVASGLIVNPTKTATITVTFQDADREIVQPVLKAVIKAYAVKHRQVHSGEGVWDDYYAQQRDDWGKKLAETEEQLRKLKNDANLISVEDAKASYQLQISRLQGKLLDAEMELAERRAAVGSFDSTANSAGETNVSSAAIPDEVVQDYAATAARLDYLTAYERRLVSEGKKDAHPWVRSTREELVELTKHKAGLEKTYGGLVTYALAPVGVTSNTVVPALGDLRRLSNGVAVLSTLLSNAQHQAAQVLKLEPQIAELERQHKLEENNYDFYSGRLEQVRAGESTGEGKMLNLSVIQSPSPPAPDVTKMLKLIGVALGGCIGLGLGLAFLVDLVIDRTIKRSSDVKRRLQLPVMLTIPDTNWKVGWLPPVLRRKPELKIQGYDPRLNNNLAPGAAGLAPWSPGHHLRDYTDGLRERLITYFEVNQLTHRPKLVAVTSCDTGVGVTTLANGLAASLSITGDGNVLLVDMNSGEGVSHSFHKGKPGCGLAETPAAGDNEGEETSNLSLTTLPTAGADGAGRRRTLPGAFNDVLPDLNVNGYDYIVFDLPPVTQTSMTPRLSGHMDMVLLVLESERTKHHLAAEASELMRGAQANVAAILNKCKAHVPAAISTGY